MLSEELVRKRLRKVEERMNRVERWQPKYVELFYKVNGLFSSKSLKRAARYRKKAYDLKDEFEFWKAYRSALLFVLNSEDKRGN